MADTPDTLKPKGLLQRDTEKVLEIVSKVLMPVLLLVMGTWFNYAMNSNQEKQRELETKQADQQRKSELVESYIKHLTSSSADERNLALHIVALESDQFDVSLVNLVSAYAQVGSPSERITALEALSHASHSKDTAVRAAASRNISSTPPVPATDADTKLVQQKAALVNKAIEAAHIQPSVLNTALDQLHLIK